MLQRIWDGEGGQHINKIFEVVQEKKPGMVTQARTCCIFISSSFLNRLSCSSCAIMAKIH